MWISNKRINNLEKRIADLEVQVQSQHVTNVDFVADKINRQVVKLLKEQNIKGSC